MKRIWIRVIEDSSVSFIFINEPLELGERKKLLRKTVSGIVLTLFLIGMLTLAFNIKPVKAWTGTVYIRADGSIDPPGAPIITYDNITYMLIGNISSSADGIIIERDNIIVDGAGYALQGTQAYGSKGISLAGRSNVTIKNIGITAFFLAFASLLLINSSIIGNNIANNYDGISLYYSLNNAIFHNNFIDNTEQVYIFTSSYANIWDDGYPSDGNYWCDYSGTDLYNGPYQSETRSDGIGDTPYVIDEDNTDRYPLMNPWSAGTPVASFSWSPSTPEVDELVTFNASASMPVGGEIVSYEWDFGDGNHASGKVVTHRYSTAGTFTVTLNATDSEGLWDVEQKQIEVKAPPTPLTVSISPTSASILVGDSVTFNSTVSGGHHPTLINDISTEPQLQEQMQTHGLSRQQQAEYITYTSKLQTLKATLRSLKPPA